jgi:predicted metalloprotease with PDZ domain
LLRYQITPSAPEKHLFTVTLEIEKPMPEGQVLRLPAWIPGSYMIRDFARHVVRFVAYSAGAPLDWRKLDKDSWLLDPCDGPVHVEIDVYAWDLSVRGAHLDTTHGYFNGTCVFLQPLGHEDQPVQVRIQPPAGAAYATWQVATGLVAEHGDGRRFGTFLADNYDALVDHPVEMGHFDEVTFEACGVPHQMVFTGKHQADLARLARDLAPVCEHHIRLFGEPAPMDNYLFMTLVTGDGYGGLEHRNSTSLMCARKDLPRRTDASDSVREGYRNFLGLCSHEYFHTWNIKRIKPAAFTPYDLSRESYTELLWAFEGITSYYDDLALVRTGLITVADYLEELGKTVSRVLRGTGSGKQTVTESSFDAWTRFYKQDENAPNAIVSYYAKGALIALCLDLLLRRDSNGSCSLDDVMRVLWSRYGKTGEGVPERGVQAVAEEVLGQSLQGFFDTALYSTEPLPLADLLADVGVQVEMRAPAGHADMGGKAMASAPVNLGARFSSDPAGARVAVVFEQGNAAHAGVAAGDILVAVDGMRTDAARIDEQLAAFQPGDRIDLHVFRGDVLMRLPLTLDAPRAELAVLSLAAAGLNERGRAWLHVD